MIHVSRGATTFGAFSEEDVREGLRTSRFMPSDLGWREGMQNWQPLSQFEEFAAETAGAAPPPPSIAPSTVPPSVSPAASEVPVSRTGLPWDERDQKGWFNAFIETLQTVLTRPDYAFRIMKVEGGLAGPIIYALIGGCAGGIVSFLFSLALQSIGLTVGRHNTFAWLTGIGAGSVVFIILLPIVIVLGLFIGGAIVHLCLMIVGGANKTFETTLRVLAFTQGSTGPLQMIPICGGIIAGVWALVLNCIGLARAHETETGRAVLAIFLPLMVCCGGVLLLAILIPTAIHFGNR
ncbi:MAG TPA: YIP1 family protein [Chthoniobacterales bacterium]|nr:YIP1 family protein [Chthoniobacterales bacterium]